MSTVYPAYLPRPQRDGYALAITGTTTATARERTAARCRATGRASRTTCTLTWILTPDQFASFAGWWRYDLAEGTVPALMALPNGHSDQPQAVRFLAPYAAEDLIGRWKVSAKVELDAPPRLNASDIAGIIALGGFRLPNLSLHQLIHVTMPPRMTL